MYSGRLVTLRRLAERILSSNSRLLCSWKRHYRTFEPRVASLRFDRYDSRRSRVLDVECFTAAAVIFYELFKANQKRRSRRVCSDRQMTNRLMDLFNGLAECSATASHRRTLASRAFHNLLSRSLITRRETSLLIGVFRKESETNQST